jgi:hypothetical protein
MQIRDVPALRNSGELTEATAPPTRGGRSPPLPDYLFRREPLYLFGDPCGAVCRVRAAAGADVQNWSSTFEHVQIEAD